MKRAIAIAATVVVMSAASVPAYAAGTSSAATSHISATVTAGDVQFDGNECVAFPVTLTYTKTASPIDDITGDANLDLRQAGSNSSNTAYGYFGFSDPASGTEIENFSVCPYSFNAAAGGFTLTGTLETDNYNDGSEQKATFAPISVGAIQNPTTLSGVKVKKSGSGFYEIAGSATATTVTRGTQGASGTITISIKKPGSKRWISGTSTSADSFGRWNAYLSKQTKGTQVKIDLTDCGWCTNATKTVKITK